MLVGVEDHAFPIQIAIRPGTDDFELDRHDLFSEFPRILGRGRLHVAVVGEFILRLTRDFVFIGHMLGGQAHPHVDLRLALSQNRIGADIEAGHRDGAHRLDPAGDDNIRPIGDDPLGADNDRLQTAGAKAIDRLSRDLDREPCADRHRPAHVQPLWPFGHGTAHDHVIELVRFDLAFDLAHQLPYDGRAHVLRANVAAHPLLRLAHRRPRGGHDHCFAGHVHPPLQQIAFSVQRSAFSLPFIAYCFLPIALL